MDEVIQNYAEYDNVVYWFYGPGETLLIKQYNMSLLPHIGGVVEVIDYQGNKTLLKVKDIRYRISMDGAAKMAIDVVVERA